jgi:predicted transposase YbfD/YdcC
MTKQDLAKVLIERLDGDNFKYHYRECEQCSHYGHSEDGNFMPDIEIVEEKWKNKEFIEWLLDVYDKESDNEIRKINEILYS